MITVIVDDFTRDGLWVKQMWTEGEKHLTRAYLRWRAMNNRCKPGGCTQRRSVTYIGCYMSPEFQDFQLFTGWCQRQPGYDKVGWQLDKDILIKGNKCYSPDTCVFVPRELNALTLKHDKLRGELPIGVSRKGLKFQAQCNVEGRRKCIGIFNTAAAAFLAYKSLKEATVRCMAEKYKSEIDPRAYEALMSFTVGLDD